MKRHKRMPKTTAWIERGSPEWHRMWRVLIEKYPEDDSGSHEHWQYMGTYDGVHEFRHRDYGGGRHYVRIEARRDGGIVSEAFLPHAQPALSEMSPVERAVRERLGSINEVRV